jgi:hypothetical protein
MQSRPVLRWYFGARKAVVHGRMVEGRWLDLCWWGWSEWYKWRWHGDHIDLGPLSVYRIRRRWLWWPVLIVIAPLRFAYNLYAQRKWNED